MWILDDNGNFNKKVKSSLSKFFSYFKKNVEHPVVSLILSELEEINEYIPLELEKLNVYYDNERLKSQRLLYLFQCDLMPGISGKIIENKNRREGIYVRKVSLNKKIVAWIFIAALNIGMLFYVMLFAFAQTSTRQTAWAQSFVLWLILEILLVSTCMVIFMHILLPILAMKDLAQVKKKLVFSLMNISKKKTNQYKNSHFNAASYLFLSYRLAKQFPDLKISQLITKFQTVWPKQSYHIIMFIILQNHMIKDFQLLVHLFH